MLVSECIKNFLNISTHKDLANLYNKNMEVQVLVDQGEGHPTENSFKSKSYTDGLSTWYNIRIPKNANSQPIDNDHELKYDIAKHALGIGMTGWDWANKQSIFVGYDFDAIVGHSSKHPNKLTSSELFEVEDAVSNIPWVTVRRSTSGSGRHIHIYVDKVPTNNHDEHAALARSILGIMSGITGFDFYSKVDTYGTNMWVWHRKMLNTNGLEIIKKGTILKNIPPNWRDHVAVVSGKRKKSIPSFITDDLDNEFLELTGQRARTPFDDEHKKLISYLGDNNYYCSYDSDHHMLITHTYCLKKAHEDLKLKGIFETVSEGTDLSTPNSFMFPMNKGSWSVRRYTRGIHESITWSQDANGWTYCYLNKQPDLKTAARVCGGIEHPTGGFVFPTADEAQKCAAMLDVNLGMPEWALNKKTKLKEHRKDKRLIIELDYDNQKDIVCGGLLKQGFLQEGKHWKRIFDTPNSDQSEIEISNFDDIVRHIISPLNDDMGWSIKTRSGWQSEPINHISKALKNMNFNPEEVEKILGSCIIKSWKIVNLPFQTEYPGNRQWNRNAAQFRHIPSSNKDNLNYPTWNKLLIHLGNGLNDAILKNKWAKENNVLTGADYLKCWISCLFQHPEEPLPYLFFYGDEDTGKSSLQEALTLLIVNGVKRADKALTSQGAFNGELENAVLCVIEETDLRTNKNALNMIKDWVTASTITIHIKGQTPYDIVNNMHFIQTANDQKFIPIFPGDTRITMIHVDTIEHIIPKRELLRLLEKEAPDFLAEMLNIEIPLYEDRLGIPIIITEEKLQAQSANKNEVELFIEEKCFAVDGEMIKFGNFYDKFIEWLDPNEVHNWSKVKVKRTLPSQFCYGRNYNDGSNFYIGNISFTKLENGKKIICKEGKLINI